MKAEGSGQLALHKHIPLCPPLPGACPGLTGKLQGKAIV